MRLSDFGLINHRWHKNDRHNNCCRREHESDFHSFKLQQSV
ncbi:BZ3500_MvSof-1268-A1-R1_Chr1-2g01487 [Microbotryum saponariae]|uniref:BZ3500_MvSof-1268-A1-R1_Chr1-2g01487 protein n=1 Tax=Microbotryum saponariae TaxID=289078 RepID=A0A2X0KG83_9BASI|nr:BZ3500_MvSof-1268-A1-R1_Chr1-2g01487 [Microbotryum saponariae]SCZ97495.1 BZ3501_MvSof-1269-A2-R1_Chr1-2g01086 [Microbotryum saponariae]